jgi:hypothetical protein
MLENLRSTKVLVETPAAGRGMAFDFARSRGTLAALDTVYCDAYLSHAIIPATQWERPELNLSALESADAATSRLGDFVGLVDFGISADEIVRIRKQVSERHTLEGPIAESMLGYLAEGVTCEGDARYLGLEYTKDSAPTLTWDVDGRRTGLHVDTFFRCAIEDRVQSPNRVCINLGPEDRYFIFSDIPVSAMRDALVEAGKLPPALQNEVAAITALFFRTHPGCGVNAIRTRPGEGYIAPTEYLVHDGFVPGRVINCSASFIGKFRHRRAVSLVEVRS